MAVLVRRHNGGRNQQRMQPVQRYQPFRELEEIQQQTAQLLEQMMGVPPEVVRPWIPDVDIEETDDAWILEAELPGARAEDVHVELDDGELTIRGAIAERERTGILRRRTRRVGEFEYTVSLPGLSGAQALCCALAALVLAGAMAVTVRGAQDQVPVGFTQLWIVPAGACTRKSPCPGACWARITRWPTAATASSRSTAGSTGARSSVRR